MSAPAPDAALDTQPRRTSALKTSDGVAIVDGLPVITNEFRVGVVDLSRPCSDPDWFDVRYPADENGHARTVMQNGDRVATRFRGANGKLTVAATEWAAASGEGLSHG